MTKKIEDRVQTGIPGLDALIEGGFPRSRTILVSGACGTGKSIFGMQYVYKGVTDYEEPGIFVTFDEMPDKIRADMSKFGWNLAALEKNDLLTIVDGTSARAGTASEEEHAMDIAHLDFNNIIMEIKKIAKRTNARRLVIDSVPAMGLRTNSENEARQNVLKLAYNLSHSGLTSIITTEIQEQENASVFSKYGVEEYVADGVLLLGFLGTGTRATRTLYVRKMRGTNNDMEVHPMEVTSKGIVVKKMTDVYK